MADMDHSVLGFSAKVSLALYRGDFENRFQKHAIILSGVFFLFFVVSVVVSIVGRALWEGAGWILFRIVMFLAIFAPILLCSGGVASLCLLKCNAKCIVIVCILWPAGAAVTMAVLIIGAFSGTDMDGVIGAPITVTAFAYGNIISSIVLLLGSIHCMILLAALGFCSRSSGGADTDLYDLESSDSHEESNSQKIH